MERVRYMRAAETFAGAPPPNGVYEWSPLLESTGQKITYWKLRLHLLRSNTHTSDRLLKLARTLLVEDNGAQNLQYVEVQLKLAWQDLRKVQRSAADHRNTHLAELADHVSVTRNTTRGIDI